MKTRLIVATLTAFIVLVCAETVRATTIHCTASGSWNNATSWTPAQKPVAGDDVIIDTGKSITGLGAAQACGTLTVNGTGAITLDAFAFSVSGAAVITTNGTITISSGTGTKAFNGNVTIGPGGAWNNSGNAALTFGGSLANSGTFTAGSGVQTFSGAAQTISGVLSIPSVTISGSIQNNGNLTCATAFIGSGTPSFVNGAGASLTVPSVPASITTFTASAAGNTVTYTANAATPYATSYGNLNFATPGGANNLSGINTINGYLGIQALTSSLTWPASLTLGNGIIWNDNSASSSSSAITMGGNGSFGGTGTALLTLTGVISDAGQACSFTKVGTSSLALQPASAAAPETYTGSTIINGGTLTLNYPSGAMANPVNSASTLRFGTGYAGGGTLALNIPGGVADSQTFAGLVLDGGGNTISTAPGAGSSAFLTLGNITRNSGGGNIDFAPTGTSTISSTRTNNAAGILGGWATVSGSDWAMTNGSGNIVALSPYTGTLPTTGASSTGNYTMGANITLAIASETVNSLNITGANTLSLGGQSLTFAGASGGLLAAGSATVQGLGTIGAGANEFIVYTKSAANMTFKINPGGGNATLIGATAGGLTKTGPGTLTLSCNSYTTPFTGPIIVHQGTLTTAGISTISSSAIQLDAGTVMTFANIGCSFNGSLVGNGTFGLGNTVTTLGASSSVYPGGTNNYGILTIGNPAVFNTATKFVLDLSKNPGSTNANDEILFTYSSASPNFNGTFNVTINEMDGVLGIGTYTLMDASAPGTGLGTTPPTVTPTWVGGSAPASYSFTYTASNKKLQLNVFSSCAPPTLYGISSGNGCSSPGVSVTLSGSDSGASYQLLLNGTNVGSAVTGTGSPLSPAGWASRTAVGTYTVLATSACGSTLTMTGNAVVSQAPTTTYDLTGGNGCSGSGVTIGLSGSDSGVSYQLLNGSTIVSNLAGTGSAISFGSQTAAGTYTVQGTNIGCGVVAINGGLTNSLVINATPGAPASLSAVAGDSQVLLSWTAPGGTVAGYNVKRSTSAGTETTLASPSASPYVDATAVNGMNYFYVVTAVNGGCESGNSTEVSATPNPAYNAYAISASSATPTAGTSDQLTITAVDTNGVVVNGVSGPIALTFSGLGASPGGTAATVTDNLGAARTLGTATTLIFVNGVSTVGGSLVAYNAATASLHVTDGTQSDISAGGSTVSLTLLPATDNAYRISAATTTPVVGGGNILTTHLVDQYQNQSAFNGTKSITFGGLSAAPDGSLATVDGTALGSATTVSFSNGSATSTLIAHKAENAKLLTATDGLLTSATANGIAPTFSPTIGAAARLGIATQPSAVAGAGTVFAQQPVVAVQDTYGNTITNSAVAVTAAAGVGNLQGTTTVNATNGTATFAGLSLTNSGTNTLTFTSSGLAPTNSSTITVNGGVVVRLSWTTQPGAATYGSAFGTQPVLTTVDQYGNLSTNGLAATNTVMVSQTSGSGGLSGTTSYNIGTAGSNGVISFTDLQINAAGTNNQLTAVTVNGLAPNNYTNLQVWLDANDTNTLALSGGTVTTWVDKSGHTNNASGGIAPVFATNSTLSAAGVSPGRVVRFNGTTTYLPVNLGSISGSAFTIIVMEVASNKGAANSYFIGNTGAATDQALHTGYRTANDYTFAQFGDDMDYIPTSFTYPQARLWVDKMDASKNKTIYLNGTSVKTGTATGFLSGNLSGTGHIGAGLNTAGSCYQGDLAEVIVYNRALTDAERNSVENYLLNKWTTGLSSAVSASFTVAPATVTITNGLIANNKFYDGTTIATLVSNNVALSGVLVADTANVSAVIAGYTANFASTNVGTNITVNVSGLTLTGSAATNYLLTQPTFLANIMMPIEYSGYAITGGAAAQAGTGSQLTITAVDTNGAVVTGVNGDIALTFSGLSAAPDGSLATVTDKTGAAQNMSAPTVITFTDGVGSMTAGAGALVAHKAETATLHVTDNVRSDTSAGGSSLSLTILQGADSGYELSGTGSPQVGVDYVVGIALVDLYQNVSAFGGAKTLTFNAAMAAAADGSVGTVNGVAQGVGAPVTFTSGVGSVTLVAHKAESGKTLTVADNAGTPLTSATPGGQTLNLGTMTAGVAVRLGIATQPSATATAGVAFAAQPVIAVQDVYGNTITTSTPSITALANTGILQGATNVNAINGTAAFTGLSFTNSGTYTLTFSSGSLTATNSAAITVSGGAITQLAWTSQPGTGLSQYDTPFGTQPALATEDQYGNLSTNGLPPNLIVTVMKTAGSGTLIGTTTYDIGTSSGNGVVTGSGLGVAGTGTNTMQLTASVPAGYGSPVTGYSVWLDANNSSSVVVSGGAVTAWNDLSGNGNNFTIPLGSGTITYGASALADHTNRNVVTFAGKYLTDQSYTYTGANLSVFVVFRETSTANNNYARPAGTWAVNGAADYQNTGCFNFDTTSTANGLRAVRNEPGCGDLNGLTGVNLATSYYDTEFIASSTANNFYNNGVTEGSSTGCVGNFNIHAMAVGGGFSSTETYNSGLYGDVAEMLVYTSALGTTDRQAVETYLSNKWISAASPTYSAITNAVSALFTVDPLPVTLTGTRCHDGTATAAYGDLSVANKVSGDDVTVASGSGTLASANVGSQAIISFGDLALGGTAATNYTLTGASGSVTINQQAMVNAGPDQTVCANSPTVTLAGAIGGSAASATWSGGAGTFNPDANALNVTYTPSAGEIAAGTVTLTLATDDPAGPCPAATASMMITISNCCAVVSAGTVTPASATKIVGDSVTFSVSPTGTAPFQYQWQKGGVNIGGANSSSYMIASAVTNDAGSYVCVVANGCGTNTSSAAVLTVNRYNSTSSVESSQNPSLPGTNVMFTSTVAPVSPATNMPTGVVIFLTNGLAFSTNSLIGGMAVSDSTTLLPHGSNTVMATFAGDGNLNGSANSIIQVVNTPPVITNSTAATDLNTTMNLSAGTLLTNAFDADGDPMTITSTSATNGMATFNGINIVYTPPTDYSGPDRIDYTVSDSYCSVTGHVNVTVREGNVPAPNIVSITNNGDSTVTITLAGIPNRYYIVQSTTNLVPPIWISISTNQAGTNGIWSVTDTIRPDSRYYRSTSGTKTAP
jgi:hypothetical protein